MVGTLPGANEGAPRDLMIGFHREIAQGVPLSRPSPESNAMRYSRTAVESALWTGAGCCMAPIDKAPK